MGRKPGKIYVKQHNIRLTIDQHAIISVLTDEEARQALLAAAQEKGSRK